MDGSSACSRRAFCALLPALVMSFAEARATHAGAPGAGRASEHPEPRPGIDASRVTPRDRLADDVAPVFDMVRAIPATFDGIRCHCGCAELEDMYSLLSCFEGEGMAQHCVVCKGQARLVHRLHEAGRSLDEIRAAVDARYG